MRRILVEHARRHNETRGASTGAGRRREKDLALSLLKKKKETQTS